jgi:hypothetical protein
MFCYAYVHQGLGANQNSRLDVLHALFVKKTLSIDDYQKNTVDKSIFDGHYYSDKAPGIVFLALPSFSVSVAILKLFQIPLDSGAGWLASSWITTAGSVGLITALGGVAMFAFLCRLVGQRYALITSLVVFLGAAPFPYATMLFSHAAVVGLICIALWAMADEEFWKRIAPGLPKLNGSSRREEAQTCSANQSGASGIPRGRDWRAAPSPSPSVASGDGTNIQGGHTWLPVPPAGTRAGTSQRDVPTIEGNVQMHSSQPEPGSSRREEAQTYSANQSEPPHVGCYDISTKRYLLAGLCCGLAISSEYTAATAAGGVLALAFLTSFRRGVLLAIGAIPALLLIPLWNWACFGSPLAFGYHHLAEEQFQEMNRGLFGISFPPKADAAWLILFSPERGLFFWTPFFLMAFFGFKSLLTLAPKLLWTVYFVVVLHVICISGYYMPSGGWALGPRHLAPMLPFLAIPTASGVARPNRAGVLLGYYSLFLTGTATLITALTPEATPRFLLDFYSERIVTGSFSYNIGSALGLPSYAGACLVLFVMCGAYFWTAACNRQTTIPGEKSAA